MKKLSYIALVLILAMCSACAQKSRLVYVIDKAAIDESMLEEYGAFIDLEDFAAQSRSEIRTEALTEYGWLVSDLKVARKKDGYEFTMVFDEPLYSIPDECFSGADGLTSVRIPNTVIKIGNRAFAGCDLVSVVIPNSVTEIGYRAFSGCESLVSVTLPKSMTGIGYNAFDGCT